MQNPRVNKKLWEYYLASDLYFALITGGGRGKRCQLAINKNDYYNNNNLREISQESLK